MPRARLRDRSRGGSDMLCSKVRATGASTKDDMHVLVAPGLHDRCKALLRHAHEGVRVRARAHRVDGDGHLFPLPRGPQLPHHQRKRRKENQS